MAGLSALHGRLRTLKSISVAKAQGKQVSVVYFDEIDGKRVIDWPDTPNSSGVLCVPRPMSKSEWKTKHGTT